MAQIEVHRQGKCSLVADVEDADVTLVSAYRWCSTFSGSRRIVYAHANVAKVDGKWINLKMHTLITGWPFVDHVDGNGLNNRRDNLRQSNEKFNMANCRSYVGSSSQYKGVSWCKRTGKWHAAIKADGRSYNLGYFTDEMEASRAYDVAALSRWGEHARPNHN